MRGMRPLELPHASCSLSASLTSSFPLCSLPPAQHVYDLMCRMKKELSRDVYSGEPEIDSLFLMDRMVDVASPMVRKCCFSLSLSLSLSLSRPPPCCREASSSSLPLQQITQLTYEGLLDEIFGVNYGACLLSPSNGAWLLISRPPLCLAFHL